MTLEITELIRITEMYLLHNQFRLTSSDSEKHCKLMKSQLSRGRRFEIANDGVMGFVDDNERFDGNGGLASNEIAQNFLRDVYANARGDPLSHSTRYAPGRFPPASTAPFRAVYEP